MNGIYSNRSNPKMLCSVTSHYRKKRKKRTKGLPQSLGTSFDEGSTVS